MGEIPEIVKLPNGRISVIRRFYKFTREDIDNANLGSLMGDFGDLDTADEQISNQGYTNCRLISVEVDTRFDSVSNTDSAVLIKTYETLTDSFVQITDDTVDFAENGLKQITRVYRAVSGTTSPNVVGVTALDTGETLASSKIEDNEAFAELTETYIESGVLSISESRRYGDSVEVYSVEGIKLTEAQAREAITSLPATAKFYGSRLSNYNGLQTTLYEFFTGSGVISTSTSYSYNNKLTRTTIVSIDETPSTPAGSVLIDSRAETRDEFILYTYTFVAGVGVVSTNQSSKYNGKLTVVTVTSINQVPIIPIGSVTMEAQVREEDGYLLYTTTYAVGEGEISTSETSRYQDKLKIRSITYLNVTAPIAPEGYTLIKTETDRSDFGIILTETYAQGSGEISRSEDNRSDGSVVTSITILGSTLPDAPANGHLVEKSYDAADGYDIYTYFYYSIPNGYSVPVSTTWRKPSVLGWTSDLGFYIDTAGSIEPATGTAAVSFTLTQPAPVSLTDVDITATSNESVSYKDGTRLVRTSTWENTIAGGAGGAILGGSYLGAETTSGAASSGSAPMPSGTITIGWESVPYFYAGGTTVYKTTHTTINV